MHLDNIALIVSFSLNILISGYGIAADPKDFSLNKIFWIFSFVFLSLVPFIQYSFDSFSWSKHFHSDTLLMANGLILLSLILYTFVRHKSTKSLSDTNRNTSILDDKVSIKIPVLVIIYSLATISLIVLGSKGLFWRSGEEMVIGNSSLQLLADKGLKGVSLYGLLLFILLLKEQKISSLSFALLLAMGIIANFPLAVPRYWAATFYLSILITAFSSYIQTKKQLFSTSIIAATLGLFPILSIARYHRSELAERFHSIKEVFHFSYTGGDFDAFTSFCSTIEYVQAHGITWGKQLATVLLFFVPRSLWAGKSVGSGALVNQLPHSDFSNFCSPWIAEGYINFGIIGTLLFMGILAWVIARYDHYYWSAKASRHNYLFYPIAIGMLFFVLRGDLLSSFAYLVGFYSSSWLCHQIVFRNKG